VSFSDLADEFNYLREVTLSGLFSKIFNYQVTQNKTLLVSDYNTRIDNNNISQATEDSIVNDTVAVIDAYVEKMRESGNTNITYEYILDNIHERSLVDGSGNPISQGDQTVTYDELIYSWRDHNEKKEHLIVDTAYCQYVINIFAGCTGTCEDEECLSSPLTCTQLNNKNYEAIRNEIESEIKTLVADLADLYTITMETNDEYNQYLGASYISVLSSASVKASVNVNLYTFIAFFFLIFVCCGGAIVLIRIGDIVHYVFYTDHLTELNNRAYFDKYLKSLDKKLLDDGTVYCVVDIANLVAINAEHSRNTGDDIIKMFTKYLKETFGKTSADFIYNGNGSFVILSQNIDYITVEDIMRLFGIRLDEREEYRHIVIEYKVGIAETFKENQTARKLLAEAIKSKKEFTSAADAAKEVNE
jgi:GGDEF domain-containing protein